MEGLPGRQLRRAPFCAQPPLELVAERVDRDALLHQRVAVAHEIHDQLRHRGLQTEYDEGGSIGKRYRRQDEIGTPWGITVDGQTLEDGTVTLRDRDTLSQERVEAEGLGQLLMAKLAEPWTSPTLG